MKVLSQYGSMTNLLAGSDPAIVPEVGMGVTELSYSDRYPGTIRSLGTHRGRPAIWFTTDDYRRTDGGGESETQEYVYSTVDGFLEMAAKCKDGQYHRDGRLTGSKVLIGHRERYYDFTR